MLNLWVVDGSLMLNDGDIDSDNDGELVVSCGQLMAVVNTTSYWWLQ